MLAPLVVKLQLAGNELLLVHPHQDLTVAHPLLLRPPLDDVTGVAIHGLRARQLRRRFFLGPILNLAEDFQISIAEVGPHEALVTQPRRDPPRPLQLWEIEPLVVIALLVSPLEETRPLHLRRREEEGNCLVLVVGVSLVVDLELAPPLATALAVDQQRHLLRAVRPMAGRVVERFDLVEYLAGRERLDGRRKSPHA
jgi:hypothetical protein